jgi:hypothetical protein
MTPDLDMRTRDVDAANRWRAYTSGWRVGARSGVPELATQPLHYTTGEDDAMQRFRAMELE